MYVMKKLICLEITFLQVDDFQRIISDEHLTPPDESEIWIGVQRNSDGTFLYQYNSINATSMLGILPPLAPYHKCASFK